MRILAVTDDANLSVALILSRTDLDVTTVGSFEGLAEAGSEGFDAVLIAYRDGEIAADAAQAVRRLSDLPCVVIASRIRQELPDGVVELSPPIDVATVERALRELIAPPTSPSAPEPEPLPTGSPDRDPEEEPEEASPAREAIAATPMPQIEAPPEQPEPVAAPEPEPDASPEPEPVASPEPEPDTPPEPVEPPEPEPDAPPEPVAPPAPEDQPSPPEDEPARGPSLRTRAARLLRGRSGSEDEPRRRRELPTRERIDEGLVAAEELQRLIDELPELNERRALAARLVEEVNTTIAGAEAVVLWSPDGEGGLEALAHHGVPLGVVNRGASTDVPVLADLLGERDTVAYRADQRFSDYLEGLPGLRGSCVLGAALRAHDEVHAVLVISGDELAAPDLAAVRAKVDLYTVALAVAAHIELLRARRTIDLTVEDGEWVIRGD